MLDYTDLLVAIKKAAVEAVTTSKPTDLVTGKVIGVSPLKIRVSQKLVLTGSQLVLTRNVSTYTVNVTAQWGTETGEKVLTIHNELTVGEEVLMVQKQGGQSFVVLDRVGV